MTARMTSALISAKTSESEAPMVWMRMNALTPWLLGNSCPNWKSQSGMPSRGYDTPLSISSGMEVHSRNSSEFSR